MHALFCLLIGLTPLARASGALPEIPRSDRVLSLDEVKNYWINTLCRAPLPAKGNGLHPEQQQRRVAAEQQILDRIRQIREGKHDTAAQLARLAHNADAYDKLGDAAAAGETEARLFALREHLAKLAKLEAERALAEKLDEELDRIDSLEAEISSLKSQINSLSCES
ncbi:hypothetical protein HAHE_23910 [Haloferula helveola]|uniref:Uncharacterized protein n=1 Tax=Haloferula helveola TaxID=490095 RepID=A0ABM7REM8_9BACT|nr:hypothetical protein HAHE_23910 [Haloferula helveola]